MPFTFSDFSITNSLVVSSPLAILYGAPVQSLFNGMLDVQLLTELFKFQSERLTLLALFDWLLFILTDNFLPFFSGNETVIATVYAAKL